MTAEQGDQIEWKTLEFDDADSRAVSADLLARRAKLAVIRMRAKQYFDRNPDKKLTNVLALGQSLPPHQSPASIIRGTVIDTAMLLSKWPWADIYGKTRFENYPCITLDEIPPPEEFAAMECAQEHLTLEASEDQVICHGAGFIAVRSVGNKLNLDFGYLDLVDKAQVMFKEPSGIQTVGPSEFF